jgi:hypothetical protein
MDTSTRRGVSAAQVAAVAWAVTGAAALAFAGPDPGPFGSASYTVIEGGHAVAETAMLFVLAAIHRGQRHRTGTGTRLLYVTAFAATALLAVITYLSAVLPLVGVDVAALDDTVPSLLFVVTLLGTLVGFVGLGVAVLRAAVWPRPLGALLIAHPFLIAVLLGVYPMGIGIGLLWLAVGRLVASPVAAGGKAARASA